LRVGAQVLLILIEYQPLLARLIGGHCSAIRQSGNEVSLLPIAGHNVEVLSIDVTFFEPS
jgi:hypothetical protein